MLLTKRAAAINATLTILMEWCGIYLVVIPHHSYAEEFDLKSKVKAGRFFPHYGPGGSKKAVEIKEFWMDITPVTQAQYEEFLVANPSWIPGKPSKILVEDQYLADWEKAGDRFSPQVENRNHPVVFVSYFSAAAYCKWKKGRLPTTLEWEYAGVEKPADILGWFANPKPPGKVGKSKPNRYGIHDLHGQVWEWTQDFNSSFASADNREDGQKDKNLFCGAGSMNARDRENYPAFMRYAMRSALRANYVMSNLGFRCVYD